MLGIRKQWLNEALDKIMHGTLLEDQQRYIRQKPFLRDLWGQAIVSILLPSIDAYEGVANARLAKTEEHIRSNRKETYDTRDRIEMWLLGRKPREHCPFTCPWKPEQWWRYHDRSS